MRDLRCYPCGAGAATPSATSTAPARQKDQEEKRLMPRKSKAAPVGIPATGIYLRPRFDVATDFDFQKRIAQALIEVAVQVYGEQPVPANHAARAQYSLAVIGDPPLPLVFTGDPIQPHRRGLGVAMVLAAQGYDASSTDAQLVAAVSSIWNALAGA